MAKDIADEMEQNGKYRGFYVNMQHNYPGGHIRLVDLNAYTSNVDDAIENKHLPHDMAICGPAPPSSFGIMQSIIAVMAGINFNISSNVDHYF
jgi:gamma-glutamyltranspeptidase